MKANKEQDVHDAALKACGTLSHLQQAGFPQRQHSQHV
jgi:hypothetical protein